MGYGGYGFRYCEDLAAPTLQLGRNAFGAKPQFTDLRLSLILHISHLGARFQKWWHDTQSEESDWVYGSPARFHSNFPTEMGSSANWVPHSIPWSSKIPLSPSYVAWGYLSPCIFWVPNSRHLTRPQTSKLSDRAYSANSLMLSPERCASRTPQWLWISVVMSPWGRLLWWFVI